MHKDGHHVLCEIITFQDDIALALSFGDLEGIVKGTLVIIEPNGHVIFPSEKWLGRVVNALGEPLDGKGPLYEGLKEYNFRAPPPPAHMRKKLGPPLSLGVKGTRLLCYLLQRAADGNICWFRSGEISFAINVS